MNQTNPMTEFVTLSEQFDKFKKALIVASQEQLAQVYQTANIQNMCNSSTASFKNAFYNTFMTVLTNNYEQFKLKLVEKLMILLATNSSPYLAQENEKIIVFPEGTKFWLRDSASVLCVIEEKPTLRTLRFDNDYWPKGHYRLAIPYVVFIFSFQLYPTPDGNGYWYLDKLRLAFRTKPLTSIEDDLYEAAFPNLKGLEVCMGKSWNKPKGSISQQVASTINYYWHAQFQYEWLDNWIHLCDQDKRFKPISTWETLSAENPLWVLEANFIPARNLSNLLADIGIKSGAISQINIANAQVDELVGKSWDELSQLLLPSMDHLKRVYGGHLSVGVDSVLNTILTKAIENLNTAFIKATKTIREQQR